MLVLVVQAIREEKNFTILFLLAPTINVLLYMNTAGGSIFDDIVARIPNSYYKIVKQCWQLVFFVRFAELCIFLITKNGEMNLRPQSQ